MSLSRSRFCPGGHVDRRGFLRAGSLGALGIGFSQYLHLVSVKADQSSPGKGEACILVWLHGGQSHLDTWDPKPNSNFKPISTNVDGILVSELPPRVANHMDKLSIVRSMHTVENDHNEGTYSVLTDHSPSPAFRFPSFSSIIAKELGPRGSLPPYVATNRGRLHGRMANVPAPQYDPMIVPPPTGEGNYSIPDLTLPDTITPEIIQDRHAFRKVVENLYRTHEKWAEFAIMDSYEQQAMSMVLSPVVRNAFDTLPRAAPSSRRIRPRPGRPGFFAGSAPGGRQRRRRWLPVGHTY